MLLFGKPREAGGPRKLNLPYSAQKFGSWGFLFSFRRRQTGPKSATLLRICLRTPAGRGTPLAETGEMVSGAGEKEARDLARSSRAGLDGIRERRETSKTTPLLRLARSHPFRRGCVD